MNRKKTLNRVFALLVAAIFILPVGMAGSAMASNWYDTEYYERYDGMGGDVWLPYRRKEDDSSVYICHQGDVNTLVSVRVQGQNGIYSGTSGMDGNGSYVAAPTGQGFYIINYVAESFPAEYASRNYKYITLALTPSTHRPCYLHGVWSPDSI